MDGENNGSKPYEQMDDLGGFQIIFVLTPILFRPLHVSHRGVICKSSSQLCTTVDGRNPAPPGMYNTSCKKWDIYHNSWLAGFLPSTVS